MTPLVYVTFGTLLSNDEALSTVVQALRDLPVRVIVTVGPAGDPASLGPQPSNVHLARYIPQEQLLPHCGAVVSHAGSGTFLATIAAGLPQLCLPQAADQFLNAAACERAAVGLMLSGLDGAIDVIVPRGGKSLVAQSGECPYRAPILPPESHGAVGRAGHE